MKKSLNFSKGGQAVQILFGNGEESTAFSSKEEVITALTDYKTQGKISKTEFSTMRDEILNAENLPWGKETRRISISFLEIGISPFDMIMRNFFDSRNASTSFNNYSSNDTPAVTPEYRECPCGSVNEHGRIYTPAGHTDPFFTKETGKKVSAFLVKEGKLTEAEAVIVDAQIEQSTLPVDEETLFAGATKKKTVRIDR